MYQLMGNIITLYHSSIYEFDIIDVNKGKPFKDFGIGFYTFQEESQAVRLALRNKHIKERRLSKYGQTKTVIPWLYTYEFDLREMDKLKTKEFATADRQWVEFIVQSRLSSRRQHDYDVIVGPTANDNTNATIDLLMIGTYGDPKSDFAINTFLELILPEVLPRQMYFGTEKASSLLKQIGRRKVW
jgi:hypothetical protein